MKQTVLISGGFNLCEYVFNSETIGQSAVLVWKKLGAKTAQVEAHMATYIWFVVSYLNYRPWQTNFAADYSQTVWTVAEIASGHAQNTLQRFT